MGVDNVKLTEEGGGWNKLVGRNAKPRKESRILMRFKSIVMVFPFKLMESVDCYSCRFRWKWKRKRREGWGRNKKIRFGGENRRRETHFLQWCYYLLGYLFAVSRPERRRNPKMYIRFSRYFLSLCLSFIFRFWR